MTTRVKITERQAASLKWTGKSTITWDSELKGFGVWVWGEGSSRAYVVQTKNGARSFRKSLGKVGEITQEKAREKATAFRALVKTGADPNAKEKAERGAWTLNDAMEYLAGTYADARKLSDAHRADYGALFRHHVPDRWKRMKLTDVTHAMVVARHKEITGGITLKNTLVRGGARRANLFLSLISRLFTLGIAHGHCAVNPATGIKKNEETERERFLSEREIATLWSYLEKHKNVEAAACVQFILLTGCRPGEAFTMEWVDLDRATGIWRKPAKKTKQRQRSIIKLTPMTLAVLKRLESDKRSAYVFPSPEDSSQPRQDKLKAFWRHVRKNCSLADVRLYDCRHSFASWLAMGGATELEIAAQLGHANVATTRRYVHLAQDYLRTKAGIMGTVIAKAMADNPSDQKLIVAQKRGDRLSTYLEVEVGDALTLPALPTDTHEDDPS